jgi:hypothetical protein
MKKLAKNALMKAFKDIAAHGRGSESRPALRCLYLDEKGNAVVTDSHLAFKVANYRPSDSSPVAFDLTSGDFYDRQYPDALPLFDTYNKHRVATVMPDALSDTLDALKVMKDSNVHINANNDNSFTISGANKQVNLSVNCKDISSDFTEQDFNASSLFRAFSIMTSVQLDQISIYQGEQLAPMILVAGKYSLVVAPVRVF